MKNVILKTTTLLLLITSVISSCKKEEAAAPSVSATTGVAAFKGNWNLSENSSLYPGVGTYPLLIEAPDQSTILFTYLYGFHTKITATVVNNNFTIPPQVIEGNSVSGSGSLSNTNLINMTYVVDNGVAGDTLTAVLTK